MTIASEITRIKTAIADAYTACQEMGATMPAVLNSDNLEQCIASISGGQPVLQHWYNWENENDLAVKRTIATPIDNNKIYLRCIDGVYLLYIFNESTYYTSTDLQNWIQRMLPSDGLGSITVYNNLFCLYKDSSERNYCYFSSDGINWSKKIITALSNIETFAFTGNKIFAYGDSVDGPKYLYYTDGISDFIKCSTPFNAITTIKSIVYGNGVYVMTSDNISIYHSIDGDNWTEETPTRESNTYYPYLIYENGYFIITEYYKKRFWYSTNGSSWTKKTLPSTFTDSNYKYPFFKNGIFIIQDSLTSIACTFNNPENTLTELTLPFTSPINTVDNYFTALSNNIIYYSSNGTSWKNIDLSTEDTLNYQSVIDNKLYIAANYKLLEIGSPSIYTLDQNPTTSSVVYDLPNTPSALTITGVETGTITLSDSNTYTYNAEGDIEQ